MIEVGDNLYHEPHSGRREKWTQTRIMGETAGTWVLDNGDKPNKKTMLTPKDRQGYATRYYTFEAMENKKFCDKHARDIGAMVGVCRDAMTLTTIAKLIGKELKQ